MNVDISKHMNNLKNILKNFGVGMTIQCFVRRLISFKVYERYIFDYLCSFFKPVIQDIKGKKLTLDTEEIPRIVWTLWWQGEENAPDLVKVCIDSQRKAFTSIGAKVIVLTKDNWDNYISIPDYILKKVKSGKITLTHFSDIIRAELIKDYGGVWIDATVYCTKNVQEDIFNKGLYTIKYSQSSDFLTLRRWTGFLYGDVKGSELFSFMSNAFKYYWNEKDALIAYLLIDYIIAIAYEKFDFIKKQIDEIEVSNRDIWYLLRRLNEPFCESMWLSIVEDTTFLKLSYKNSFNGGELREKTEKGECTYWGFLKSGGV